MDSATVKFMCTFFCSLGYILRSEIVGSYHICMFHRMARLFSRRVAIAFYVPRSSVQGSNVSTSVPTLILFFFFPHIFPSLPQPTDLLMAGIML